MNFQKSKPVAATIEPTSPLEKWMATFLSSQIQSQPWHVTWTETTAFAQFRGDFEVSDGDCTNKKYLILGHNLSPGLIQRCGTICVAGKDAQGHGRTTTTVTGK